MKSVEELREMAAEQRELGKHDTKSDLASRVNALYFSCIIDAIADLHERLDEQGSVDVVHVAKEEKIHVDGAHTRPVVQAAMDAGTCEPCRDGHGTTGMGICENAAGCRCVWIEVAHKEAEPVFRTIGGPVRDFPGYKCDHCDERFRYHDDLREHERALRG